MRTNYKPWSDAEIVTLRKHYARLGAAGMRNAGYLADRSAGSVSKFANILGLVCESRAQASADPDAPWPLPTMGLVEQLDCLRLKNWRGPVNRGQPLRCVA